MKVYCYSKCTTCKKALKWLVVGEDFVLTGFKEADWAEKVK